MNQSIIFFDIDGTLITDETYIIPESAIKAIKKAQDNGHLAFINTGRPISEIDECIRELNFDGYVCGCGTYIDFRNQELFYKSIGTSLSKKIALKLREYHIDGILEGKKAVYYDYDENIKSKEVIRIKNRHINVGFYHGDTFDEDDIDFDKLVIWTNENSNFEAFYEEFKDVFDFIHRGEGFYELVPLGYSKASGIEFLIKHLNIPFENTYAIGDSTNDLSMLQYVKNSIAMGNSHPKLFDLVSYITKDIEEDGIAHALEHYGLI